MSMYSLVGHKEEVVGKENVEVFEHLIQAH